MGMLLVFEGEEEAPVHYVDMGLEGWHVLMTAAKSTRHQVVVTKFVG